MRCNGSLRFSHERAKVLTNTNDDTPRDAHAARARDVTDAGTRSPERHADPAPSAAAIGGATRGASGTAPTWFWFGKN